MTSVVVLSAPEPVWELGAPLLEGPIWVARDSALWFVDIKSQSIHRYDPASDDKRSWDAPAQVGFCLPAADGRFIVGLQTGLARFDPADGSFEHIVDPEPALPVNRLNDGTVDRAGRLYFGTMDDGESAVTGRIWRWDRVGRCVALTDPVAISNGPAVSPDGKTLYHVDTLGGIVHAATIADDGSISDSRHFVAIPPSQGNPDGPAVDSKGCVWISLYGGGTVHRYAPDATLLEVIRFPVGAITKIAFGGEDGRTLFATTAAKHLDAAGRAREPLAGALFACRTSVCGAVGHEIIL